MEETDAKTTVVEGEPRDDELATVVERLTPHDLPIGSAPTMPGTDAGLTSAPTLAASAPALSSLGSRLDLDVTDLAAKTLMHDELLRSRSLGRVGVVLSLFVAVVVPFLGGEAVNTGLVLAACGVALAANVGLVYLCRDPNHYRRTALSVVWLTAGLAVGAGVSFFGVFSPAPLAAGIGIYFISLGHTRWLAYAVWILIAGTIGAVTTASMTGLFSDPGLITADTLPIQHRLLLHGLLQGLLLGVFVLGRHSRRSTAQAITELERTTRALAHREALLDEARLELRAALATGGAGPWSGRQLGGYHIGALLGRGGMGEVYEAIGADDSRVAIKLLTPASALDVKIVERFRREAEITAALESTHIVRVFAVSDPSAPVPYLVMERLSGDDLAAILRTKVVLKLEALKRLVEHVAAGLEVARGVGVVHRDIKPQNLFAVGEGGKRIWKILDFGVSKLGEHSGTLTQGKVIGTPAYMAPEQAKGSDDVGHAADAYALAAIAYRCITGRPPFRGKSTAALLYNVVYEMPVRPSSLVKVSSALDAALALGMAKDPAKRTATAGEFATIFASALRGGLAPGIIERARELETTSPWRET